MFARDGYGKHFRSQALAVAYMASENAHVFFKFPLNILGIRSAVFAIKVRNDAGKDFFFVGLFFFCIFFLSRRAIEKECKLRIGKALNGGMDRETLLGNRFFNECQILVRVCVHFIERLYGTLGKRKLFVRDEKIRVKLEKVAETSAGLTCATRIVE